MAVLEHKILGQTKPANTTAVSIYSPTTLAIVDTIIVANTTGSAAVYSIFLDSDGTTYTEDTALFFSVSLAANTSVVYTDLKIPMNGTASNLAVKTGTNNALTFTVFGAERTT
jgi:hypothetical protein